MEIDTGSRGGSGLQRFLTTRLLELPLVVRGRKGKGGFLLYVLRRGEGLIASTLLLESAFWGSFGR